MNRILMLGSDVEGDFPQIINAYYPEVTDNANIEHRARWWMLVMCTYHFLFMLTGNRGDAVIRIIVML